MYGGPALGSHPGPRAPLRIRYDCPMPDRIACHVEHGEVRPEHHETVEDLVYKLFERRHHRYVGGQEQDWLTVELIQSLRRESKVYREELSTKTDGPLPFALGYFQLREGALTLTTDEVPANVAPRTLVRFLSEFVKPGARFWFGGVAEREGWEIRGVDEIVPVDPAEAPAEG